MHIELQRTFGPYTEPQVDDEDVDWHQYFSSNRRRLSWNDLHPNRVTVVLGEAGIGKTVELQLQAKRMRAAGQYAFFLPLNILDTPTNWELALDDALPSFSAWLNSSEDGFFFLDAVDEARLQTHADFKRAILVVRAVLAPNIANAKIVISSRVTDWTVPDVQTTVATHLLEPINQAIARERARILASDAGGSLEQAGAQLLVAAEENAVRETLDAGRAELLVVTLDALSKEDAHRCARCFKLEDEDGFWSALQEGDYEFMASRPLDLQWMVRLWNQRRVLGTYAELIEASIIERLREPNDLYHHAKRSLAESKLREGAAELAAAMEFGGAPFIAVRQTGAIAGRILDAFTVLRTWRPDEVQLLLATAIFDEASFDRVKFHHRSVREYLAAQWVNDRLTQGVPLGRLEPLFAGRPNGELTLIPSRRPVLAWLAAINVRARAWVISMFPEILLHEGDPQSWDQHSADLAFNAIIRATETRPRIRRWYQSSGEYLRISRALSPGHLAAVLGDTGASLQARSIAYRLARHGKLKDCANAAFGIYRDKTRFTWETTAALSILEEVGTFAHREEVLADIESGTLATNELIAAALPCVPWPTFSPIRLAAIFNRTQSEGEYGTGPMAEAIRRDILPKTDLASTTLLLQAVLASLPKPEPGQTFERFPPENQPQRAWLLHVLPLCFLRALELSKDVDVISLPTFLGAAEQIATLRYSGFVDRDDLHRVKSAIILIPELRWSIAAVISQIVDIQHPADRLVWDDASIVTFGTDDLPELIQRSQQATLPLAEQDLWFKVGVEVAIRLGTGRARAAALRALSGPIEGTRATWAFKRFNEWHAGGRTRRKWEFEERIRKETLEDERALAMSKFIAKREIVADGSDFGSLRELLFRAHRGSAWNDNVGVDLELVASQFGRDIAELFGTGLRAYWKRTTPPNPSNYPNGGVPWEALAGLSGVTLTVGGHSDFSSLTSEDVFSAAQLAVWALPGPPPWFEPMYNVWSRDVETALNPWVIDELKAEQPGTGNRGAFALAMNCPPYIRRALITGTTSLVLDGAVKNGNCLKQLVPALFEDGLMSQVEFDTVCQSQLERVTSDPNGVSDLSWLQLWATGRPHAAWTWFKEHISTLETERCLQLQNFASAMANLQWIPQPWDSQAINLLLQIAEVLTLNGFSSTDDTGIDNVLYGPPAKRMFYAIARGFIGVRGTAGRNALLMLIANEADSGRRSDLLDNLHEHAEHEASAGQQWNLARLRKLHSAFDSAPQDEAQLYEQVLARLEEIRISLEEGPFSERKLFSADTPEKHLQLWLAAKFRDTQNRRFSVHREEEVDNDKKTDIQLSCRAGNVCVEIKPVDADRGYSANSLTDTLLTQIVGQYLKGNNSSRGILVLVQLDTKGWDIPGGAKKQPFEALVTYLERQAQEIKVASAGVNELTVFPMRCVI